MVVGDVGASHGSTWGSGDETYCVDRCITMWKHESGMVNGRWLGQRDATTEQGGVGIGVSDGARVETWTCGFHGDGAVRADGMRGDRVAVGDIGALHGGAWGSEDASCGDDGRGEEREQDGGILSGPWLFERYVKKEPCGYWVGISDGARVEPWACGLHGDGAVRPDWM